MVATRCLRPMASRFLSSSTPRLTRPTSTSASPSPISPPLPAFEHLLVTEPKSGVTLVTLNRPKTLNALSTPLITSLNACLLHLDSLPTTRCIVLTGSARAFAAGADIREMSSLSYSTAVNTNFIASWSQLATLRTPIIAAVNGYALGGGCELALMADILYCSTRATFGQPEIKLGTIPGAGGSQRLTRAIGKSRAMELILTGKTFSGTEAGAWGVAARVFETEQDCVDGAVKTAETVAGWSRVAARAAKEVVNRSQELGIRDGVEYERKVFHGLFGSRDREIGMRAFLEKKTPVWVDE